MFYCLYVGVRSEPLPGGGGSMFPCSLNVFCRFLRSLFPKISETQLLFPCSHLYFPFVPLLEFYTTFKDEYTPSCYLDLTRKLNSRKELVKLRIGNHNYKLLIETGRYDKIPRDNRLCPTCESNQIEDEVHLLFHCTKYCSFREEFYKK